MLSYGVARGWLGIGIISRLDSGEALQCRLKPLHFAGFQVVSCQVDPGWPRRLSLIGTSRWISHSWKETPLTVGARRRWRRAAGSRLTRMASSSPGKAKGGRQRCWTYHRWPGLDTPSLLAPIKGSVCSHSSLRTGTSTFSLSHPIPQCCSTK